MPKRQCIHFENDIFDFIVIKGNDEGEEWKCRKSVMRARLNSNEQ